jgi:hypothetical protein
MSSFPSWVLEMVEAHYDRIAEGVENKPYRAIAEMIYDGYLVGREEALVEQRGGTTEPQ